MINDLRTLGALLILIAPGIALYAGLYFLIRSL